MVTPAVRRHRSNLREVYYLSQGSPSSGNGEEWESGYNTTELEDGYMEVSVPVDLSLGAGRVAGDAGAVPQRWHQPAVDAGSSRRRRSVGLNYHISTQDTSWLMVEFTDSGRHGV